MPSKERSSRRSSSKPKSTARTARTARADKQVREELSEADRRKLRRMRDVLDGLNEDLCALCDLRVRAAGAIAAWKAERGLPMVDPAREKEMLARVARGAVPEGLSAAGRLAVLRAVLRGTKAALRARRGGLKARGRGGVRGR